MLTPLIGIAVIAVCALVAVGAAIFLPTKEAQPIEQAAEKIIEDVLETNCHAPLPVGSIPSQATTPTQTTNT